MLDIYVISTDLNTGGSRLPYPFYIYIVAHIMPAGMLSDAGRDCFLHFIIIEKHRILLTVTTSLNKEMKMKFYTLKIQQNDMINSLT